MKVVPALLSQEIDDYRQKLALVASFTDYVQIDFMDGIFVPSRSVTAEEAANAEVPIGWEAHLMVADPLLWARSLASRSPARIIFHAEAVEDIGYTARRLREMGFSPGLALNPSTSVEASASALPLFDAVLVMSVNPGFYGSPFIPGALEKAAAIREVAPNLILGLDGGVSQDNIPLAKAAGFHYACVGSRIFLAEDPAASFAFLGDLAR